MTWLDKAIVKYGGGALIVVCAVGLLGYGCGRRYAGKLAERAKQQERTVKDLGKRADSIRTVYVKDTAGFGALLARYNALRAQFGYDRPQSGNADTLRITDTLAIPVGPARSLIATADSTIRACARALHDCDALQAAEHARADSALALAQTYKRMRAPWVQPYAEAMTELGGGYTLAGGVTIGRRLALTARGELPIGGGSARAMIGFRLLF